AWGGVLADRKDKRRLITITQAAMAAAAGGLAVVTFAHVVELWMVYASAIATGIATAFDHPARTAFVSEMVPPEHLTNAVGLNSALMTGSRLVGPALAGVIIALWDVGPCFLANAISFLAVIVAMVMIRPGELLRSPPV